MMPQGRPLDKDVRAHVVALLKKPEITAEAIATRTGCGRSTVLHINDVDHIREYDGHRSLNYTIKSKTKEA